ncbi:hypothetical protein JCM3774_000549 [Rhodotorula dairenensis]
MLGWTVSAIGLWACATGAALAPAQAAPLGPAHRPVPIVLWHGLGDRFDGQGLQLLKHDLESRPALHGVFVHVVQLGRDGPADQRATFFGLVDDQVTAACAQLAALPDLTDRDRNPSRQFDAVGFSQGGQFLRAVVERCTGVALGGVTVRNLITLGSQHMGISALPPCPPGSSPFSFCKLMHLSLVREGVYSTWAQRNIVPAQYFRDPDRIDEYLDRNAFLRDINNERIGDVQPDHLDDNNGGGQRSDSSPPRNATYKDNFSSLNRFVMFRFSNDVTVVPPHSAHFTLPAPPPHNDTTTTTISTSSLPCLPPCYAPALAWSSLPLYRDDYIGLKGLNERRNSGGGRRRVVRDVCKGEHMQIGKECWDAVVSHLGAAGEGGTDIEGIRVGEGEDADGVDWDETSSIDGSPQLILQPAL